MEHGVKNNGKFSWPQGGYVKFLRKIRRTKGTVGIFCEFTKRLTIDSELKTNERHFKLALGLAGGETDRQLISPDVAVCLAD